MVNRGQYGGPLRCWLPERLCTAELVWFMVRGAWLTVVARCAELWHLGAACAAAGVWQRRKRDPARQAQVRGFAHSIHALLCPCLHMACLLT